MKSNVNAEEIILKILSMIKKIKLVEINVELLQRICSLLRTSNYTMEDIFIAIEELKKQKLIQIKYNEFFAITEEGEKLLEEKGR